MNKNSFHHSIPEIVRFHEVDLMSVCNNAVYFNYFEDARITYLKDLNRKYKLIEFMEKDSYFIMAHNECDYKEPALFDQKLNVYTKISFIKNSSFGIHHLVERVDDGKIIAEGKGVLVHINLKTKMPMPLPQEFYDVVLDFEDEVSLNK